jgi:hypothetical protein
LTGALVLKLRQQSWRTILTGKNISVHYCNALLRAVSKTTASRARQPIALLSAARVGKGLKSRMCGTRTLILQVTVQSFAKTASPRAHLSEFLFPLPLSKNSLHSVKRLWLYRDTLAHNTLSFPAHVRPSQHPPHQLLAGQRLAVGIA